MLHLLRRLRKPDRNIRYRARLHTFGELVRITRLVGGSLGFVYPKRRGPSKYGNIKTGLAGKPKRDSKLEESVEALLEKKQNEGVITELRAKPRITFYGVKKKKTYIPDFAAIVVETNQLEYWEAKGFEKEDWAWKLVMWELHGPAPLHVYKGTYKFPTYHETIWPADYKGLRTVINLNPYETIPEGMK